MRKLRLRGSEADILNKKQQATRQKNLSFFYHFREQEHERKGYI